MAETATGTTQPGNNRIGVYMLPPAFEAAEMKDHYKDLAMKLNDYERPMGTPMREEDIELTDMGKTVS